MEHNLDSIGVTVRDNKLTISLYGDDGYALCGGSLTITESWIKKVQDPKNSLVPGKVLNIINGTVNVRVGRSGDEKVAENFHKNVPSYRTTFNRTAKKLNFAFLCTMEIILTGGSLGTDKKKFTFHKVGIAQGKAGARNDWWFGGVNCRKEENNIVSCRGVDEDGKTVIFKCKRKDHVLDPQEPVNNLIIFPAIARPWMHELPGSRTLRHIILPGSHDAGMYIADHLSLPGSEGMVRTQATHIWGAACAGLQIF